jgi:hypothetical protein
MHIDRFHMGHLAIVVQLNRLQYREARGDVSIHPQLNRARIGGGYLSVVKWVYLSPPKHVAASCFIRGVRVEHEQ